MKRLDLSRNECVCRAYWKDYGRAYKRVMDMDQWKMSILANDSFLENVYEWILSDL